MKGFVFAAVGAVGLAQGSGPDLQLIACDAGSRFQQWQYRAPPAGDTTVLLVGSNNMCIDINSECAPVVLRATWCAP